MKCKIWGFGSIIIVCSITKKTGQVWEKSEKQKLPSCVYSIVKTIGIQDSIQISSIAQILGDIYLLIFPFEIVCYDLASLKIIHEIYTDLIYSICKEMSAKPVIGVIKAAPPHYMGEGEDGGLLIRHLKKHDTILVNIKEISESEGAFSHLPL